MSTRHFKSIALALLLSTPMAWAAPAIEEWERSARQVDDAYWSAYNHADPDRMNAFLDEDVEFYHDRGGELIGKRALAAANQGMVGAPHKLRREALPGTVHFYPMRKDEQLYGVLVTGEHQFFVVPDDKPAFAVGRAYFTQLMRFKQGSWKISRIFSYEHVDAKN